MPKITHNEMADELVEEEALQNELRYGTNNPKELKKRKAAESKEDAEIMKAIRECEEEIERRENDEDAKLQSRLGDANRMLNDWD